MAPFASLYNNRVRHRRKPGYAGSLETLLTCIGRGLFSISLDLHATSHTAKSFAAGQISHVDKRVVKRRKNVGHGEVLLALQDLAAQGGHLLNRLLHLSGLGLTESQTGVSGWQTG